MQHRKIEIPLKAPVRSLCWRGDGLIDWVGGNRIFSLDGTATRQNVAWSYRFDAAVQSPSGTLAVLYERLGTKAILVDGSKCLRELNRSFYHANAYEYPIVLFQHPDGRELIAHCPEHYNQIEIEELKSGKRLTQIADRKPNDFFQSRLAVSPGQTQMLSAGWVWHPFDTVASWSIAEAIADARVLDRSQALTQSFSAELNSATFIDERRVVISSNPDPSDDDEENDSPISAGSISVCDLTTGSVESTAVVDEPIGTMLWVGDDKVIGFFEHPKLIHVLSGEVIFEWPDLFTGKQSSSIIHHIDELPPLALDPSGKRFAVATADRIIVILL